MDKTEKRIRSLMKKNNYSLGALSNLSNIPKTTLHRYLSDTSIIPLDRLSDIAVSLNTTPAYLMGWTDDEKTIMYYSPQPDEIEFVRVVHPEYKGVMYGEELANFIGDHIEELEEFRKELHFDSLSNLKNRQERTTEENNLFDSLEVIIELSKSKENQESILKQVQTYLDFIIASNQ